MSKNIDNIIINLDKKIKLFKKHCKVISYNEKQLSKINGLLSKRNIKMIGGSHNEYAIKANEGLIVLNNFSYLLRNIQLLELYKMYNKLRDKLYEIISKSIVDLNEQIPDKPTVTIELLDIISKEMGKLIITLTNKQVSIDEKIPVEKSKDDYIYYADQNERINEILETIREEINKPKINIVKYNKDKQLENKELRVDISRLKTSIELKNSKIKLLKEQIENKKTAMTLKM